MQAVSAENMKSAIRVLFNSIDTSQSPLRPNIAGDLDRYAAIAAFMTNDDAFRTAMRNVAAASRSCSTKVATCTGSRRQAVSGIAQELTK